MEVQCNGVDALAACRVSLGLRSHTAGLEPMCPGLRVGRKRNPDFSRGSPGAGVVWGAALIPALLQEMEPMGEGLSGQEAPLGSITWTLHLCLIPGPATLQAV